MTPTYSHGLSVVKLTPLINDTHAITHQPQPRQVVNQLLSKLDGIHALDNVLVIGLTNRKDMIDDAVLRPGRLEVHVEVSEGASEQEQRCWKGCIFLNDTTSALVGWGFLG